MNQSYILSIDQGTSSTKAIIFDGEGKAVARGAEPLKSYFFEGGLVEQDAEEIFKNVLKAVKKCLAQFSSVGGDVKAIKTCGISNQRETFVVWDREGKPLHNAIVWQCKRSVKICEQLKLQGFEDKIKEKSGLIIDPYFSGTKLVWLNENVDNVHCAIQDEAAYFGTIDTWLLFKLTNGRSYFTDYTNASRTLFFDLHTLSWNEELLSLFGLSNLHLPLLKPSSSHFGETNFNGLLPERISISSMIGDSHAAAFGEGCFSPGTAKATLGTGSSILMNIGSEPKDSANGMITTICWSTEERVDYAFEGVIVSCGSTLEWLKNELGLFTEGKKTEALAKSVPDNNGVYLVPAFSGLGAPHWDMNRKASITGLTFDCNKNHIIRAALESIPYQIKDVIVAMENDASINLKELMVDGGITSNKFVLQLLSDLLERRITNIGMTDVSALGAAYLAGLKVGIFESLDHLKRLNSNKTFIEPKPNNSDVKRWYAGWRTVIGNTVQRDVVIQK